MTNYRHVLSNKMLSALHATDVIYMSVYLSAAAGTSGSACAQSSTHTLSSPQGMHDAPHGILS